MIRLTVFGKLNSASLTGGSLCALTNRNVGLQALVHRAALEGDEGQHEDEEEQIGKLIAQAAVATLSAASDDADAAQRVVARLKGALAAGLAGLVLLRLLLAVADLPAVCKVRSLLHRTHCYMALLA